MEFYAFPNLQCIVCLDPLYAVLDTETRYLVIKHNPGSLCTEKDQICQVPVDDFKVKY